MEVKNINGYDIKDETARNSITTLEGVIATNYESLSNSKASKTELDLAVEDIEASINTEKSRIDNLATLSSGSTTGDAELIDARVDYKGNIHTNVGSHIRNLTSDIYARLKSNVSVNLFDKDTCTRNAIIWDGKHHMDDTRYFYSDYIKVTPGAYYTVNSAAEYFACYYDENKTFIENKMSGLGKEAILYTFQIPTGVHYIRFNGINGTFANIGTSSPEVCMLVEGKTLPTEYVPYGILPTIGITSRWEGKKIVCFGDSITWYDEKTYNESHTESGKIAFGYESWIRTLLGANVINEGYNGDTIPQILPHIKSFDYTNIDCVTLTGGANDFRDIPTKLGEVMPIGSTFDETTTIGALQSAIEYILSQKPNCVILIATPIKGYNVSGSSYSCMPTEYPDAMKEIAKLYSLPICDWYYESGINELNLSSYCGDITSLPYRLHPTNAGYERMGRLIAGTLTKI